MIAHTAPRALLGALLLALAAELGFTTQGLLGHQRVGAG